MIQPVLVALTAFGLAISLVDPRFPQDQLLQHVPTVPFLAILFRGAQRHQWSTPGMVCLLVFTWLHIIGARFVYSNLPYDRWIQQLCGWSLNAAFGWKRNHYDRFVHLMFGLLMVLPVAETITKRGTVRSAATIILSVGVVAGLSSFYEIVEWLAAVVMSPGSAETYNGQQGDLWDAQKDMALAFLGSLLAAEPARRRLSRQIAT